MHNLWIHQERHQDNQRSKYRGVHRGLQRCPVVTTHIEDHFRTTTAQKEQQPLEQQLVGKSGAFEGCSFTLDFAPLTRLPIKNNKTKKRLILMNSVKAGHRGSRCAFALL